ncbi:COG5 [Scenedesmus sp. PABB004]|nr:COG5 [Scenedesmus sp. PABB004]
MGKGGRATAAGGGGGEPEQQQQQPPALLESPQFAPFLASDFNAAEFTSRVLAGSRTSAQAQAEELRAGVRSLEGALSAHVLAHHADLLGHARRLADMEHALQDVVLSVSALQAAVTRVRAEVAGPYAAAAAKTRQLANVQATIDALRHLTARLKAVAKLRAALAAAPALLDLAKAAKLVSDVAAISREADLRGIAAAEADEPFLAQAAADIQDQAQAFLIDGMESLSQAKVGSALQVFFNLEQLHQAVDAVLQQHLHELERAFKLALDSRHLSAASGAAPGAGPGGPGGARGLDKLWQCLRAAADCLASGALAVWHLQRVVAKKRDPLSHALFLDALCPPGTPLLTEKYWAEALRVVGDAFAAAARPSKGGFVRDALTGSYPRLVGLLEGAFDRITRESRLKGVPPAAAPEALPALLDAAGPFRDAYLAAGLGRMQEVVGAAFPGSARGLPTPADVQKTIGALHEELKAAGGSAHLAGRVGGTVGKALRLLGDKAEYMAAAGPELRQVALGPGAGGANPAQLRNIALCSQLQEVHRSMLTLLPRLPAPAAAALAAPLEGLQGTAVDAVAPIFKAAMEVLEGHVQAMHGQAWGPPPPPPGGADGAEGAAGAPTAEGGVTETSGYVTALAGAITTFRAEYLNRFIPPLSPAVPSVGSSLAERAAARLLMLWLRHACLLRPLGQGGKLQLAKDMAELQLVVGQGLYQVEAMGPANRCLRAFRALLFTDDAALPGAACLRELPPALVLQHCFSRLPAGVETPAERAGMTPQQFSRWLDQHPAADVIARVAAALDGDAAAAAAAASPGAAAVLGVMRQLCGLPERQ